MLQDTLQRGLEKPYIGVIVLGVKGLILRRPAEWRIKLAGKQKRGNRANSEEILW
jgi:hypothetical protein